MTESYDYLFKLLLVGDAGVGKSSIVIRYTDDKFSEDQPSTIGVDFKVHYVTSGGNKIKLTIWDTAGQERFRTLTSSYYRGAQGVILVYDVTRRETFEALPQWLKEVDLYSTNKDAVRLLVANKVDCEEERVVTTEEGIEFARVHNTLFIECSAKTKKGIVQAFTEVVDKVLDKPHLLANAANPNSVHLRRSQGDGQDNACGYC
eukprot:GFYU01000055.1.p1 GENE.GFYU01000055.1~~GFYU01000055.1.p1  ORF type:complete len:204 (-),score=45.49 GFYU01000055.1:376-987(-)